ncbi:hypothetical protein CRV09_01320 [Candidatus Pantoea edessiphila]|uniref:Ancillary SecYEG translocon subunit n=1 Tax=Candidatus Pantoea edessiphila TaxID=2044610 RepID=A0A2P5T2Y8_9GAMM|nr:tetratricopeptide repeat protein [Candidatus Pantoea edessiphila]PPI88923.1 hypothetical protein CRV09_01320 [Candidatus Pantoea edessiphila]
MYTNEISKLNTIKELISRRKKILIISTIFFISILMLIVSGWLYLYQNYNESNIKNKHLFEQYQKIINLIQFNKPKTFLSKESLKNINTFINTNKNIYGVMVGILLAKYYINNNNLDKAFLLLKTSLKYTKDPNLISLINLRLARIQIEQHKFDEALKTLDYIKIDDSWINMAYDLRGDALFGKDKKKLAKDEWTKAAEAQMSIIYNQIVKMKLNK